MNLVRGVRVSEMGGGRWEVREGMDRKWNNELMGLKCHGVRLRTVTYVHVHSPLHTELRQTDTDRLRRNTERENGSWSWIMVEEGV